VIALLNTVLAFFYYLRVIVAMWLSPAAEPASLPVVKAVAALPPVMLIGLRT